MKKCNEKLTYEEMQYKINNVGLIKCDHTQQEANAWLKKLRATWEVYGWDEDAFWSEYSFRRCVKKEIEDMLNKTF